MIVISNLFNSSNSVQVATFFSITSIKIPCTNSINVVFLLFTQWPVEMVKPSILSNLKYYLNTNILIFFYSFKHNPKYLI